MNKSGRKETIQCFLMDENLFSEEFDSKRICTNETKENELANLIKFFKTIIAIEHNNFRDSFLLNVRFSL